MTRDIHTNGRHGVVFLHLSALVSIAALLVSCGGQGGSNAGAGDGDAAASRGADICSTAKDGTIKADAQLVVVVIDRTASARTNLAEPPDLQATIAKIQAKGVEDGTGSQLQTLNVTASGRFPSIGKPMSLDLRPGDTSQNAKKLRSKILDDCVPGVLFSGDSAAPGSNTDLLGALLAADQQKPAEIVVVSSGLNSTAQADLSTPPADPAQLADSVKQAVPAFASWTTPVRWFNLGEPNPPLSAPDRDRVMAFWKALLGDKLDPNTREGAPAG